MGKSKKKRREKQSGEVASESQSLRAEKSGVNVHSTANDSCTDTTLNDKAKKKANKKFGLSLLRQANDGGWEGHELGKLALLISDTMQLKKEKFINFLVKSRVISSQMIAGLQDLGFDFGSSAIILGLLYDQSESNQKFLKVYSEALDNSLFSVKDLEMIMKLSDITQRSQFSRENVTYLLRVSCSHTESLRDCGQLLACFCMDLMEKQSLFYITQVMKFDFVLDLFGLLEDFLSEMGELRRVVEGPIREILKVNRLGEIVDSDADDDGNLRDFVVDDDDELPKKAKKKSRSSLGPSTHDNGSNGKGNGRIVEVGSEYDSDEEEYADVDELFDDEALEGRSSESEGEDEWDSDEDDDAVFIHQRTWSHSSDSEEEYQDAFYRPDGNSCAAFDNSRKPDLRHRDCDSKIAKVSDTAINSGRNSGYHNDDSASSCSSSSEEECQIQRSSSSQNSHKRKRVINEDSEDSSSADEHENEER